MAQKPVIFLAFADMVDPDAVSAGQGGPESSYLPKLGEEVDAIYDGLQELVDKDCFEIFPRFRANLNKVSSAMARFRTRIALFHFSGHANSKALQFSDGNNLAEGLARAMGQLPGLQLVFLNGCATKGQIKHLFSHGIKAVIATSVPVQDSRAMEFSKIFYLNLGQGSSIEQSFQMAHAHLESKQEWRTEMSMARSLVMEAEEEEDDLPWGIYWNPAIADQASQAIRKWALPTRPAGEAEPDTDLDLPPDPKPLLYRRLKTLNYSPHIRILQKFLAVNEICGMVIQGKREDGQTWLGSNHLTHFSVVSPLSPPYIFSLGQTIFEVSDLVKDLKYKLGLPNQFDSFAADIPSIAKALCEQMKQQSLLIRIDGMSVLVQHQFLEEMVSNFWTPLCKQIQQEKGESESTDFKKLILLVVIPDRPLQTDLPCLTQEVSLQARHDQLLLLPPIKTVNTEALLSWLDIDNKDNQVLVDHPTFRGIYEDLTEAQAQAFLESTEGMPPMGLLKKVSQQLNYLLDVNAQHYWELTPKP